MNKSYALTSRINRLLESEKLTSAAETVFGAGKIPEKLQDNKSLNFQGHKSIRNEYKDEAVKAHTFIKSHGTHMGSYDHKDTYGTTHVDHYSIGTDHYLVHHDRDHHYTHGIFGNPSAIEGLKSSMSYYKRLNNK